MFPILLLRIAENCGAPVWVSGQVSWRSTALIPSKTEQNSATSPVANGTRSTFKLWDLLSNPSRVPGYSRTLCSVLLERRSILLNRSAKITVCLTDTLLTEDDSRSKTACAFCAIPYRLSPCGRSTHSFVQLAFC